MLDTTVNHVPEVFEYQFEPDIEDHDDQGDYEYILAGSSCLAGDVLGVYAFNRRLTIGSRVVLTNVGRLLDRQGPHVQWDQPPFDLLASARPATRFSAGALHTKILSLASGPAAMRLYEHEWDFPWPSAPGTPSAISPGWCRNAWETGRSPFGSSSARAILPPGAATARSAF